MEERGGCSSATGLAAEGLPKRVASFAWQVALIRNLTHHALSRPPARDDHDRHRTGGAHPLPAVDAPFLVCIDLLASARAAVASNSLFISPQLRDEVS